MTVHCCTISSLSWFQVMAVHGRTLQYMRSACPFWSAFESAALHAHPVAFSSSHCMHKQVYSSFDSLASATASAHPATRGFGRRCCFGSVSLATPPDGRGRLPRADPGDDGQSILYRWGFCWRRLGGRASGETAFDDLGLGISASAWNFEDVLVE